ncbi:MAG: hypothetical protein IPN34_14180 [Planctomycetes bacterium]|nr:hypothetical protein [Planctomycetota bacterium]
MPPRPVPSPRRTEILSELVSDLQRPGFTSARVARFRWNGRDWILKDYAPCSWLGRWVIGPFSLWRERRAYGLLQGIDGVPEMLPAPDRRALIIAFVPGRPLSREALGDPERFLAALERLLAQIHERGIAHLDLRTKTNLIVDERGLPWLIDFSSAVAFGRWPLVGSLFLALGRFTDRSALLKYRARYAPEMLGESEEAELRRHGLVRKLLVVPALWHAWRSRRRAKRDGNAKRSGNAKRDGSAKRERKQQLNAPGGAP